MQFFNFNSWFPLDEPSKPGKPEIFDYDNVSVSLKWQKPESDGGRPITHYTVEMKDKFAVDWVEVTKTADATPEAKVEGLKEKMIYQFRVRAHNKAGASEPSEPTDNHLCKHKNRKFVLNVQTLFISIRTFPSIYLNFIIKFYYRILVKPRIDRTNFKSVIIKAGRTHKWSVDITGEPPPEIKWIWRDNIPLTNTERIKIDNVDYHTDFTIVNAMRKDTGKYTLKVENANGTDEETVELTVLGKFRLFLKYSYILLELLI